MDIDLGLNKEQGQCHAELFFQHDYTVNYASTSFTASAASCN
jgi:hypothetical protein